MSQMSQITIKHKTLSKTSDAKNVKRATKEINPEQKHLSQENNTKTIALTCISLDLDCMDNGWTTEWPVAVR